MINNLNVHKSDEINISAVNERSSVLIAKDGRQLLPVDRRLRLLCFVVHILRLHHEVVVVAHGGISAPICCRFVGVDGDACRRRVALLDFLVRYNTPVRLSRDRQRNHLERMIFDSRRCRHCCVISMTAMLHLNEILQLVHDKVLVGIDLVRLDELGHVLLFFYLRRLRGRARRLLLELAFGQVYSVRVVIAVLDVKLLDHGDLLVVLHLTIDTDSHAAHDEEEQSRANADDYDCRVHLLLVVAATVAGNGNEAPKQLLHVTRAIKRDVGGGCGSDCWHRRRDFELEVRAAPPLVNIHLNIDEGSQRIWELDAAILIVDARVKLLDDKVAGLILGADRHGRFCVT